MPSLADFVSKGPQSITAGRFTVASTGPLTVYLDGGIVAVTAFEVNGCTYTVGGVGQYIHIEGQQPMCFQRA